MPKKSKDLDQPLTRRHLVEITRTIREMGDFIMKELREFRDDQKRFNKEITWKVEEVSQKVKEVSQKVKEVSQKVDTNTSALTALDKKVRYQEDMPERLEHVESKTYELDRRVTLLEK